MPKMKSLITKTHSNSKAIDRLNTLHLQASPDTVGGSKEQVVIFLLILLLSGAGTTFSQRLPVFNILDHGAKADGQTVNTNAINQAIQAGSKAGGGTVYIPSGTYLSGT